MLFFFQLIRRLDPGQPTADESTHKLPALEKVAVVGVCCRVSGHEAEDLWSERQHGGEGDGGQRAGVEQELREGRGGSGGAALDVEYCT